MAKLTPFVPSRRDPWDARKARHLLNRAGFGATPEEIDALVKQGFDQAVHRIVNYDDIPDPLGPPDWLNQPLDLPPLPAGLELGRPEAAAAIPGRGGAPGPLRDPERAKALRAQLRPVLMAANRGNRLRIEELRAWWLDRMVRTPRPLEEKLTLFWHGHFATQSVKVRIPQAIYMNNELLRRNATGSFRDLTLAVSKDPAMLLYLDNNQNRREHPNENYARELMELFTLGIGHYTEVDVKQSARAFTGWSMGVEGADGSRRPGPYPLLRLASGQAKPAFIFRPFWHDDGEKQFLGQRGNFDGSDIVRIILEQPACAEFICGKLVRYFVSEDRPQPELVAELAALMRRSDYQLKPVLGALFRSQAFYADDIIGGQIKSPIQLVAGAVKQLRAEVQPPEGLTRVLFQMGQIPFDPPNVAGWHGGKQWINTSTLLARYNFPLFLLRGHAPALAGNRRPGLRAGPLRGPIEIKVDVAALYSPDDLKSPERLVDALAERFLSLPLSPAQRAELIAAARQSTDDDETRVKQLVHLVMSTPNYQVC